MPGSIYQYFVTQCTLTLNNWEGKLAVLCQCDYDVLRPEFQNFDGVSEKSYTLKNPVRNKA